MDGQLCVTYGLRGLADISLDPLALSEGDVQGAPPGALVDVVVVAQERPDRVSGLLGAVVWNTSASTKASSANRRGALTGHEEFPKRFQAARTGRDGGRHGGRQCGETCI